MCRSTYLFTEEEFIARHQRCVQENGGRRPTAYPAVIFTTQRLVLREMIREDYDDLCDILKNKETMYAYAHGFSEEECRAWMLNQQHRYETYGFGLWAVIRREDGTFLGQCGLTIQDWNGGRVLEVGYLFRQKYWHNGYATEAAAGCIQYAFEELHAGEVCTIIRDNNLASQAVARRNGLVPADTMVKHYYDMDMPHIRFVKKNPCLSAARDF